jgi:hypothetical protein
MKLQTTILPRKSGQVIARGADGAQYVFEPDESGDLVCDVQDQATVAMLIKTGNFHPADPAEYETGIAVAQQFYPEVAEIDEPLDDDHENLNAMPIEEETPPSRRKPRKAK